MENNLTTFWKFWNIWERKALIPVYLLGSDTLSLFKPLQSTHWFILSTRKITWLLNFVNIPSSLFWALQVIKPQLVNREMVEWDKTKIKISLKATGEGPGIRFMRLEFLPELWHRRSERLWQITALLWVTAKTKGLSKNRSLVCFPTFWYCE